MAEGLELRQRTLHGARTRIESGVVVARAANDSEASAAAAAAADKAANGGGSTALPAFGGMFVVWIVGDFSCRCSADG